MEITAPRRAVRLFRNGSNQSVRIPREFEFPTNDALMYKEGSRLIIEPASAATVDLLEALKGLEPIDDEFPDVDAGLLPVEEIDL